jgi:hypothetical protein
MMPASPPDLPLRYEPSLEQREENESETIAELCATMRKILEIASRDHGHAVRSVHAKSHGLLRGELRVMDDLPPVLAQGLFSQPRTCPVVMRYSTNPGDILDDSVSAPRGLAIKVTGVEGERLPGAEGQATQDFVLASGPAFQAPDAKTFLKSLKALAMTTDTPQAWKKAFSATLRGVEKAVEKIGRESTMIKGLGGQPATHILGETFYSQAPLLYGPYIAKLAVAPVSHELAGLTGAGIDLRRKPDALRDAVSAFFETHDAEWEVRAQLCTNLESMPIENASAVWPEDESPYVAVARITAPRQPGWSDARSAAIDDGLAFNPWHGLAAHRPLGSIMRARKPAYAVSAEFRSGFNRRSVEEPQTLDAVPDT